MRHPAEGVESFARACHELAVNVGIKMSLKEQGIDEKTTLQRQFGGFAQLSVQQDFVASACQGVFDETNLSPVTTFASSAFS